MTENAIRIEIHGLPKMFEALLLPTSRESRQTEIDVTVSHPADELRLRPGGSGAAFSGWFFSKREAEPRH